MTIKLASASAIAVGTSLAPIDSTTSGFETASGRARGQAGPYSVIASYITSAERYGFEPIPIFMLAHDDVLVGDDPAKVTFEREGVYTDETTGKPVAATTRYTYRDGEDRYVVSFARTHDLAASRMIDTVKGVKRIAAKLAHFDGAYLRFVGDIEISRYRGGDLVETHKDARDLGTDVLRARPDGRRSLAMIR